MTILIQHNPLAGILLQHLLTFRFLTFIHETGEIDGSGPREIASMNKLLATCRRTSKPIDKIQLTELTSSQKSMQDWSSKKSTNPSHYAHSIPEAQTNHLSTSSRSPAARQSPLRNPPRNPRLHNPHPHPHPVQTLPRPHARHPRWRSIHSHRLQTHRRRSRRVIIQ